MSDKAGFADRDSMKREGQDAKRCKVTGLTSASLKSQSETIGHKKNRPNSINPNIFYVQPNLRNYTVTCFVLFRWLM